MKAIELKKLLIHRIKKINDIQFPDTIKTILDSKVEKEILLLSPEQKNEIVTSQAEVKQGLYIDSENLDDEVKLWVNEE